MLGVESDIALSSEDNSDYMHAKLCDCIGRAHKCTCPFNPGRNMLLMSRVEPTDKTNASELQRPCPKKKRFSMNIGDYVCVYSSFLGKFHLPCRIIGDFGGRYQLYCSKGILNTAYSRQELTPCVFM